MKLLFAAALLVATPSLAGLGSRPAEGQLVTVTPMEGLYAGAGAGGALLIIDAGNGFGYDVEGRLGYSFNPGLQLYLSGAIDGATINNLTFRSEIVGAFIQYHLYARPGLGVYGRAGIGVGLSSSFGPSAVGLATSGGLGVEIGLGGGLFLAPELFYKNASLNLSNGRGGTNLQIIGLQLALIFY